MFLSGNRPDERVHQSHLPNTDDEPPIALTDEVTDQPTNSDSLDNNANGPDSDDSDLLCLSDDPQDSDSAPLLGDEGAPRHRPQESIEDTDQSWLCGTSLQFYLFYYSKAVHVCRFGLLILYLIVLGGSLYFNTKITPSEKPPSFFKEGSNLQQLLDLKYNMSGDNYDCKICDNIVEVASNFINAPPTEKPIHTKKPLPVITTKAYSKRSTQPTTKKVYALPTVAPKPTILKTARPTTQQRSENVSLSITVAKNAFQKC